jgi:hypothetical protein
MNANELIQLSIEEDRTVTEYPETQAELEALLADLLAASEGDADYAEHSGAGYCGPEENGYIDVWSDDGWRVELMIPSDGGAV